MCPRKVKMNLLFFLGGGGGLKMAIGDDWPLPFFVGPDVNRSRLLLFCPDSLVITTPSPLRFVLLRFVEVSSVGLGTTSSRSLTSGPIWIGLR